MSTVAVDASNLDKYGEQLKTQGPFVMGQVKKDALLDIGKYDMKVLRDTGLSKLNIRSKGTKHAFKYQLISGGNGLSEYSKWKSSKVLQDGGVVRSKGKWLTILTDAAKGKSGKRKYTQEKIREELKSGKMTMIMRKGRTPLIVRNYGKLNKKGQYGNGARSELIAVLKPNTQHKGQFFNLADNFNKNASQHEKIMETSLNEIVNKSDLVDKK